MLDRVNSPEELKALSLDELKVLAIDIRQFLIENVSKTGGHLASNLGVVELTIALHYCFNSPTDKLIWDVGHQAYVHKILTGRKDQFDSLRQWGGLSGFLKREESPHDAFEAGHSSTSISAGIGMAIARDIAQQEYDVVSVIGDGALTGGMALEALNFVGHQKTNMKVILNDNEMSISENVGGISKALSQIRTTESYAKLKGETKSTLSRIPNVGRSMVEVIGKLKDTLKYVVVDGGYFFEELGLTYIGPINGHNVNELIENIAIIKRVKGPVVMHVITQKGKGYIGAEINPNKYHGVGKFDPKVGVQSSPKHDYSSVFAHHLIDLAEKHDDIVAISAAMITGTGLTPFKERFPERTFDVGIAEQHGVTMAAGLATQGIKPFVAIYSTFLQRAYDQILHDVCIQKLPVVFCIDRAGLVGNDGETHHGVFDLSYLSQMPNMTVLSPKDEVEFKAMLDYAYAYKEGPVAIRYPRGNAEVFGLASEAPFKPQLILEEKEGMLITTGKMTELGVKAAHQAGFGVVHVPCIKPIDVEAILAYTQNAKWLFTLEDNTVNGGLGEKIEQVITSHIQSYNRLTHFEMLGIQDTFVSHGNTDRLLKEIGLDVESLVEKMKAVQNG